jgi:hypothetical protein
MAVLEPLWMSTGAWEAIGAQVIDPAESTDPREHIALDRLRTAWRDARHENGRVAVFIDPDLASALAALLDRQPQLAALLGS